MLYEVITVFDGDTQIGLQGHDALHIQMDIGTDLRQLLRCSRIVAEAGDSDEPLLLLQRIDDFP